MTGLTGAPGTTDAPPKHSRLPRLRGLTWLVWRQHRTAYWTVLAASAGCLAWIVYQRTALTDFLTGHGWPARSVDDLGTELQPYTSDFQPVSMALGLIPVLLGVFIGAPLFAGDLENGTAKLVTAQSVSRTRWLAVKLGVTGLVIVVASVALSVAFGWWWSPVRGTATVLDWTSGSAFDTTGPVPVALSLLTFVGGAAIGVALRRTLASMVVTFAFAVAVQLVWSHFRLSLGDPVVLTTERGVTAEDSFPVLPGGAYQLDQSYLTGDGDLLGWSTCVQAADEQAHAACLRAADVVGWSVEYLPISQMGGMQWLGAGIVLALTAGLTVFLFVWGRKRLV
ncbi:ABC transporter [Streptomyces sp. NPDC093586]|uniref:ABC transporter n=1 Tax=Streptomyces sp. NPDC093586 TaxID=3366042 RepID=UPI00381DCC73